MRFCFSQKGFSLIEILVVIAIIGILSTVVLASLGSAYDSAYLSTAKQELRSMRLALEHYYNDHGEYPPDADRNIPAGLEDHLTSDDWPDAPWPGSVYDWDAWDVSGDGVTDTWQVSIRFCPQGVSEESDECQFPNEDWAEDFDQNSSVFYCVEGNCRAHVNEPADHPAYCVNCQCSEIPNPPGCG